MKSLHLRFTQFKIPFRKEQLKKQEQQEEPQDNPNSSATHFRGRDPPVERHPHTVCDSQESLAQISGLLSVIIEKKTHP